MKRKAGINIFNENGSKSILSSFIVLLNVVLLVSAIFLYGRYIAVYQERLREENLGNIANLNQSAAGNATSMIDSWNIKLDDIEEYVNIHRLNVKDTLSFIADSNSIALRRFELIGSDYTGYSACRDESGNFSEVSYSGSSYAELQEVFDGSDSPESGEICLAPEFTDDETAHKSFALYKYLNLRNETGETEKYTLLLSTKSSNVVDVFNNQNDFNGQSAILADKNGNYIVSNSDFKSVNIFQYLYLYNDLTLDQRNIIEDEVATNGCGELYYKNAGGEECVFRYDRMSTNDWYCITCVPISSFHASVLSSNYVMFAVIILMFLLAVDVTWFRLMNKRLRASMLREKEASDAKTDFLSRMSHDIRTPLNGIIGLSGLAVDEPNPPKTQEYLKNIRLSGSFLLGLVNDILDMSRVESGKIELHPEPYSIFDLSNYVEAVIKPLCNEKGLELRTLFPKDGKPVMLDRLRFNQIVFNLLSNSVKYTSEGGYVGISYKNMVLHDNRVAIDIGIYDNGIGMSSEFQEHMFEAFSQEHEGTAVSGAGLGLSIVWNLVNLMGGKVSVDSKQNQGTTFWIHLETDACDIPDELEVPETKANLNGRRVLMCEDNQINIIVSKLLLEKWGVIVDVAENGKIGLDLFLASEAGTYDAVLMDIMMPEMNGLEASISIRNSGREDALSIPIIAMTANAYDRDIDNCLNAGMNTHLSKPINANLLREELGKWIK